MKPRAAKGSPKSGGAARLQLQSTALEASANAVVIIDRDGCIAWANPAFTRLTGYTPEDAFGHPLSQLTADHQDPVPYRTLWETIRAGDVWRGELLSRRKDGSVYLEGQTITPVRDSCGEISHFIAIKADITDRRQTETALRTRTQQLEAIRAITSEITQELDLPALLRLITERAVQLVSADSGTVFLWNESRGALIPTAWHGFESSRGDLVLQLGEAVAGTVAQRREGLIVNDYRSSPFARPAALKERAVHAVLGEPLVFNNALLGAVTLDRCQTAGGFTSQDQDLLALFAAQAAIAIENARLHAAALRRGEQMEALLRATRTLMSGPDLQGILDRIVTEASQISGSPHVKVLLLDREAGTLRAGAVQGTAMPLGYRWPLGADRSSRVAITGEPLFNAESPHDPSNIFADQDRELGIVTYLGLPIKGRDEIFGVLTFNTTEPREYSAEDLAYLAAFADQAALAIENARLYQEIQHHATSLETRVQERTRDLDAARRQAEAASRAKSDFLTNMSHELRTPLNSILDFAQILQDQLAAALSPKQARFLSHIYTSGQHLLQLINDILDLSMVEAGKIELQPVSFALSEALDDLLVLVRGLAGKKGQAVTLQMAPGLPRLTADPLRFKQILFNLLSNAVKFTPEGGQITVAAQPASDGTMLTLRVTDTGIGIAPGDLPKLFREFVQLEATETKRHQGTGLGLALTKRLVEMHGGRIQADSEGEGRGSAFTVFLPFGGPAVRGTAQP